MAYNFRPSRPKAAGNSKRLVKRESVFQVEHGPITEHKRDTKQLDEFRNRSFLQRENNKFKTTSQRSDLTVGEQEIEKHFSKPTESSSSQSNQTICSVQTLPAVEKDWLAAKITPSCFEYVQNYHHYVLDLNKLEKGGHVPYLSRTEKQNGVHSSKKATRGTTWKEENRSSKSVPTCNYFSGLPRKGVKSASRSRRGSVDTTAKTDSNFIVNNFTNTHSPRGVVENAKRVHTEPEIYKDTLQDLIVSEIEDELEESRAKESSSELTMSHVESIYQVPNPSTTDLRVPSGTPTDTPRSSSVHHSFPNLPNNWSSDLPKTVTSEGVASEVRKPHMAAFTTRIPPLKAPDFSLTEERRKRKQTNSLPDYQRYRILCDAFRPVTPRGGRGRRPIDRSRPNFVTSEELDYYIDVVNSINVRNGWYSY